MAENISILGSTGSIGVQTLDVARHLNIRVSALTAYSNIDLIESQAKEFRPRLVSIGNADFAFELSNRLKGSGVDVYYGPEGMKAAVSLAETDTVVTSLVGIAGLIPTIEAIRQKKDIALANKETLVAAGQIVMREAQKYGINIFPVDSEHSAIYQCLAGSRREDVRRLILTASGGPFRGRSPEALKKVTVAQALRHPNWNMGKKITIDSATLMNKGLELIEARWLFGFNQDLLTVVLHPQSIIHSMVEYADGSIIAQMGTPDMRIPIQIALTWPKRPANEYGRLDLLECGPLTFEKPDTKVFPCLDLASDALKTGGTMPAVLNGANEAAVEMFLQEEIPFAEIAMIIEKVMELHNLNTDPDLNDIIEADRWARNIAGGIK